VFVFQSCIVLPYRQLWSGASRANVDCTSDIVSLVTEGGNQIVLESRDPEAVSRHSRLYLKYTSSRSRARCCATSCSSR
jgi:hypothetical protein